MIIWGYFKRAVCRKCQKVRGPAGRKTSEVVCRRCGEIGEWNWVAVRPVLCFGGFRWQRPSGEYLNKPRRICWRTVADYMTDPMFVEAMKEVMKAEGNKSDCTNDQN
jgi:hypothetical protein